MSRHDGDLRAELRREKLSPQLEGGENTEEAFAQSGEGGKQHHSVGSEVVRLKIVELQE